MNINNQKQDKKQRITNTIKAIKKIIDTNSSTNTKAHKKIMQLDIKAENNIKK